jgi:hypothetical protein
MVEVTPSVYTTEVAAMNARMETIAVAMAIAITVLACAALSGCVSTGGDATTQPQDRPYAAASPSGGIPVWSPGDKFVAVAGGTCRGSCPVYELYVFDDGRVIFVGKKNTSKSGTFKKQVAAEAYAELLTQIVRSKALDGELKRGTCLPDRSVLTVMRSSPDGQSVRTQTLNSGCEGHADLAKQLEGQFIQWTETERWF